MRVMCINEAWRASDGASQAMRPVFGNTYTVIDQKYTPWGWLGYELAECIDYLYKSDYFIPLSDIDERELLEQRQEQLQNA